MIPERFHLFWTGSSPSPALVDRLDVWRALHPRWDVRLWGDTDSGLAEIIAQARASCSHVYEPDHVRHVANVVRWWLLAHYGGIWVDCDVHPRRAFDDLRIDTPFTAALRLHPTPFVIGGPAEDPLWTSVLAGSLDNPTGRSPIASGGGRLQAIAKPGEIRLIEAEWFADHDSQGAPLAPRDRYSTHDWATSSTRGCGCG